MKTQIPLYLKPEQREQRSGIPLTALISLIQKRTREVSHNDNVRFYALPWIAGVTLLPGQSAFFTNAAADIPDFIQGWRWGFALLGRFAAFVATELSIAVK
jgi:hypothetical protein